MIGPDFVCGMNHLLHIIPGPTWQLLKTFDSKELQFELQDS